MSRIPTSIVEDAHAYTKSKTPWRIDACVDGEDGDRAAEKPRRRLLRYISGGGLRAFGRTMLQDEADMKRSRFLVACGVLGAVWLYFWIWG